MSLPEKSGVYFFKNQKNKIIYIGKAKNLKRRISSYFRLKANAPFKTKVLVNEIKKISHIIVNNEIEALLLEAYLIKKHTPKYNILLKDGKSYPYIKIIFNENIPKIFFVRKIIEESPNALYYGPYPHSGTLRFLLKKLRPIFPFCTCVKPIDKCLYRHLKLCPSSVNDNKNHLQNLDKFRLLFEGKINKLLFYLHKEMILFSDRQMYEKANEVKIQIEQIKLLMQNKISPDFYEHNPRHLTSERIKELKELKNILNLTKIPKRIECYDISNISGKSAVGSLVVSVNGFPDHSLYRRFKIKIKTTPDDYAMLKEVMDRRLKHIGWKYPDLIIVDGGLGQVNAVIKLIQDRSLSLPLIGISKSNEEIVFPNGQKFLLKNNNKAYLQITRLRDEAHRFALKYHHYLRSKKMLN